LSSLKEVCHIASELKIEPNMGVAYLVNLVLGALIGIAVVGGGLVLTKYVIEFNPITFLFEMFGIPIQAAYMALAVAVVVYAVFRVNGMESYSAKFSGNTLTYAKESLLKSTEKTSVSNITGVTYNTIPPFTFGNLVISITGGKEDKIVIKYVLDVKRKSDAFNMVLKGGEQEDRPDEEVTEGDAQQTPEQINFEEELIGYIEDEIGQGYGLDQIKKDLQKEGYPPKVVSFAASYVEKHNRVSAKEKEKKVSKDDASHHKRRFHVPVISVVVLIAVLMGIFTMFGIGDDEDGKPKEIDIFLYDNLGIQHDINRITDSEQLYSRDELVDTRRGDAIIERHSDNPLFRGLEASKIVTGFKKRATLFTISGEGGGEKTLVELRFQPDRPTTMLKVIESVPKSVATSDEITLTTGGVMAEKDPVMIFTFTDLDPEKAEKAVYVVDKRLEEFDTTTFAAEQTISLVEDPVARVCGDGKCVVGESYLNCCDDCGCLPGFVCERSACAVAEKDECRKDADCDDGEYSTKDSCSGKPKTCSHEPIIECVAGDRYCPEGCVFEDDADCPFEEPVELMIPEQPEEPPVLPESDIPPESPDIQNITITPDQVMIGDEFLIEARVTDANGDLKRVWVEVMELAESHGEVADLNDEGMYGGLVAGDDIYSIMGYVSDYYLTGQYHTNIFAEDWSGNKKKRQATFVVS